jgi:hypothetical protein
MQAAVAAPWDPPPPVSARCHTHQACAVLLLATPCAARRGCCHVVGCWRLLLLPLQLLLVVALVRAVLVRALVNCFRLRHGVARAACLRWNWQGVL